MVATSSIRSQREYAASIQQTRRRAPQPAEPAFVPSRDPAPPQSTVSGYKGRAFAQRPASATLPKKSPRGASAKPPLQPLDAQMAETVEKAANPAAAAKAARERDRKLIDQGRRQAEEEMAAAGHGHEQAALRELKAQLLQKSQQLAKLRTALQAATQERDAQGSQCLLAEDAARRLQQENSALLDENGSLKRDKAQLLTDLQFALRLHQERHEGNTPAQQIAVEAYAARALQAAHRGAVARREPTVQAVRARLDALAAKRAEERAAAEAAAAAEAEAKAKEEARVAAEEAAEQEAYELRKAKREAEAKAKEEAKAEQRALEAAEKAALEKEAAKRAASEAAAAERRAEMEAAEAKAAAERKLLREASAEAARSLAAVDASTVILNADAPPIMTAAAAVENRRLRARAEVEARKAERLTTDDGAAAALQAAARGRTVRREAGERSAQAAAETAELEALAAEFEVEQRERRASTAAATTVQAALRGKEARKKTPDEGAKAAVEKVGQGKVLTAEELSELREIAEVGGRTEEAAALQAAQAEAAAAEKAAAKAKAKAEAPPPELTASQVDFLDAEKAAAEEAAAEAAAADAAPAAAAPSVANPFANKAPAAPAPAAAAGKSKAINPFGLKKGGSQW